MNWSLLIVAAVTIPMLAVMLTSAQEANPTASNNSSINQTKFKCRADGHPVNLPNPYNCHKFLACNGNSRKGVGDECTADYLFNATLGVRKHKFEIPLNTIYITKRKYFHLMIDMYAGRPSQLYCLRWGNQLYDSSRWKKLGL